MIFIGLLSNLHIDRHAIIFNYFKPSDLGPAQANR